MTFDAARLVVLDEFGVHLAMTRLYARAPVGERAYDHAPGRGANVTLLFGLRTTGVVAPTVFPGALNATIMETYARDILGPELKPGDVVVMDRLNAHKHAAVIAALEARGAEVVLLPPYSPDFSPIENCGSKVKTALRGAAARTYEALVRAIGDALRSVTPDDACGWFAHCGYRLKPG